MSAKSLLIVGGGPAGMMAGYLFARAGVPTTVIEKHGDFLRDFRGDTVHPSTLDILGELGLLDAFLQRPHNRVERIGAWIGGRYYGVADFRHLPAPGRFVAMMPQWEFLDFLAGEARRFPSFTLRLETEASDVVVDAEGRVAGVLTAAGERLAADLVIAADGRRSILRQAARLPLHDLGAPIDVMWFRVPKTHAEEKANAGYIEGGEMIVVIDRGDYFQCGRVIAKGRGDALRRRGLDAFRREVAATAPVLGDGIADIDDWDKVKLLAVSLDRLERWSRPGLLAIGDAAHAMSPVGGVGINLAIQDAVAAANILAAPLAAGEDPDPRLEQVQARRLWPVKVVQGLQRAIHHNVIGAALAGEVTDAPALLKLVSRAGVLQRLPARVLGMGVRREHVRSPAAAAAS